MYVSSHLQNNPADLHPQADASGVRKYLAGNTTQGSGGDVNLSHQSLETN